MKNYAWIKGFLFSVILCGVIPLLFMLFAQGLAGGITSFWGESWLYFAVIVPFVLNFTVLGHYFHNKTISNKKMWLISLVSAFTVSLYSGTIGTIFGETIVRGGIETVNIEGTLVWGTIYTFILLPITIPIMRLLIEYLYHLVNGSSKHEG